MVDTGERRTRWYPDWRERVKKNYTPRGSVRRNGHPWAPLLPLTYEEVVYAPDPRLYSVDGGNTYYGHPATRTN